ILDVLRSYFWCPRIVIQQNPGNVDHLPFTIRGWPLTDFIILVCAFIAIAAAAPQYVNSHEETHHAHQLNYGGHHGNGESPKQARILRYETEQGVGPEGYKYAVETSDGVVKEEQGVFENAGTKEESLKVVGRYLYPGGPNGELLTIEYVADKNGFQPIGEHIPKPVEPVVQGVHGSNGAHGVYGA
ncbi:unnamed protein product, partial [Psylliodes chrysocephalus]